MVYAKRVAIDLAYAAEPNPKSGAKVDFTIEPLSDWSSEKAEFSCLCCKTRRKAAFFPELKQRCFSFVQKAVDVRHKGGQIRSMFCIFCLNKLVDTWAKEPDMDVYKAIYRVCFLTGIYYNEDIARKVILDKDRVLSDGNKVDKRLGVFDLYTRALDFSDLKEVSFFGSDNFVYDAVIEHQCDPEVIEKKRQEEFAKLNAMYMSKQELSSIKKDGEVKDYELSDIAKENKAQIVRMFHYDPFEKEAVEDREGMYVDLVTMLDDAMAEDLVRQKAAIEIVRSFKHIEKLSDAIRELQTTPEAIVNNEKQLKSLTEQKKKETDLVTQFSKDHGFAERYALSRSKGSGTLSAVVRDMKDSDYDRGAPNRFDIETSNAIKFVSDISAESLLKQIQFSESEYAKMIEEQSVTIRDLTFENEKIKEEIRLLKEKNLKQELLDELEDELRRKRVPQKDIEELLKKEIRRSEAPK